MIDAGLPKAPRVEVSAAWLAEQRAKQRAYEAERDRWRQALEPLTHSANPAAAVCRCRKCRQQAASQAAHFILKPDAGPFAPMGGNTLVVTFITGVVAYKFRDRIPYSTGLFVLCLVLTMASFWVHGADRFAPVPVSYVTVYLGLLNPPRQKTLLSGDYSYGIHRRPSSAR